MPVPGDGRLQEASITTRMTCYEMEHSLEAYRSSRFDDTRAAGNRQLLFVKNVFS